MAIEADRQLSSPSGGEPSGPGGPVFWGALAIGGVVMAIGIFGVFSEARATHPSSLAIWVIGSLVVHDLLIAPATFAIGGAVKRYVPARFRTALQFAMFLSAMLVVISIPVLVRSGARPDNPSLLPRNYTAGLIVAVAVTWLFAGGVLALSFLRRQRK